MFFSLRTALFFLITLFFLLGGAWGFDHVEFPVGSEGLTLSDIVFDEEFMQAGNNWKFYLEATNVSSDVVFTGWVGGKCVLYSPFLPFPYETVPRFNYLTIMPEKKELVRMCNLPIHGTGDYKVTGTLMVLDPLTMQVRELDYREESFFFQER